ncbi:MAG: hypothetical protein LBG71_05420 [Clostridiales Family XIII bacterium]|nr:hypothetical protein [Clostridiales Family XIII bacterium]
MPFLLLGLLIVIAVILYLRFSNTVGDPSLKPRPFSDLFHQSDGAEEGAEAEAPSPQDSWTAGGATAGEAPSQTGPDPAAATSAGDVDPASFKSMEELTEFYRREAERLTGIKH